MTARLLLLTIFAVSAQAFAMENPCHIEHDVELNGPSIEHCIDFKIEPGVTVITKQFAFIRKVDGNSVMGALGRSGRVICQADDDTTQIDCGNIQIDSFSIAGALYANAKSAVGHLSGAIAVAVHGFTANDFAQKLTTGEGGQCTVLRNGQFTNECTFGNVN